MFPTPSHRHLTSEGLAEYLASGDPAIVPVDGTPSAQLVIEPAEHRVTMRFETARDDDTPDVVDYAHFSIQTAWHDSRHWFGVVVEGESVLLEAYPLLCLVADRVQHEGVLFRRAVEGVLTSYKELLGSLGRLSESQEVGLFGELLFLHHLVVRSTPVDALDAWRGGAQEEHDFGLVDVDVEVKTTTAERRAHWIHKTTQLEPSYSRDLWLLSLQLTSGGQGAISLPGLVEDLLQSVSNANVRKQLEKRLKEVGWHHDQAVRYKRRFRIRSEPVAFLVDERFPAITRGTLETAGLDVQRFPQVNYQVDLTGLMGQAPTNELLESFVHREPFNA